MFKIKKTKGRGNTRNEMSEMSEICERLFELQSRNNFPTYHARKNEIVIWPFEYEASRSLNELDASRWTDICIRTGGQSRSHEWYTERHRRSITCSRAHRIKTKRNNFEKLIEQFQKNQNDLWVMVEWNPKLALASKNKPSYEFTK